jgi:hypothetical protein
MTCLHEQRNANRNRGFPLQSSAEVAVTVNEEKARLELFQEDNAFSSMSSSGENADSAGD